MPSLITIHNEISKDTLTYQKHTAAEANKAGDPITANELLAELELTWEKGVLYRSKGGVVLPYDRPLPAGEYRFVPGGQSPCFASGSTLESSAYSSRSETVRGNISIQFYFVKSRLAETTKPFEPHTRTACCADFDEASERSKAIRSINLALRAMFKKEKARGTCARPSCRSTINMQSDHAVEIQLWADACYELETNLTLSDFQKLSQILNSDVNSQVIVCACICLCAACGLRYTAAPAGQMTGCKASQGEHHRASDSADFGTLLDQHDAFAGFVWKLQLKQGSALQASDEIVSSTKYRC